MKFKPGDKVWLCVKDDTIGIGLYPGRHAAVIISQQCDSIWCPWNVEGHWVVDVEGRDFGAPFHAHEKALTPRDDPPSQQEPKREELGSWDDCEWRPATVRFEMALREYTRRLEWEELTT